MGTALLVSAGALAGASRPAPALAFQDVVERASFVAMGPEWNALAGASAAQPFHRHEYIRAFLENFLPSAALKLVTGRDAAGRLALLLPLVAGRASICGIPARELASPTNVHSLRFDPLLGQGTEDCEALLGHLAKDVSWDVIRITDVPEGGQAWQLQRAAQAAGFPVGAWESQRSPYIALPASHGELMAGVRTKFRANLRRRRKRLAETGTVCLERVAGAGLSEELLCECLALERSSWKGRQGSAVSQSQAVQGFHLELLRNPAFHELQSLFLLKLDGRPIAFHYGLTAHGVYSLVLTSYDERFKELSPGHLLTEDVLEDCIARGLGEFDFLGCDLPWKLEWTRTVRPHHWLYIFRDSLFGRSLRQVKFGWGRAARDLLTSRSGRP